MKDAAVVIAFLDKLWKAAAQPLDPSQRPRLDALRVELEAHEAPQFALLAARRLLASNTLRGGDSSERARWDAANQELAAAINQAIPPSVALAARLNYLLISPLSPHTLAGNAKEISSLRTYSLFGADGEYLPPEFVPDQAAFLDERLFRSHEDVLQDDHWHSLRGSPAFEPAHGEKHDACQPSWQILTLCVPDACRSLRVIIA